MKKKLLTLFLVILLSACSTKKPVPGIRKEVFLNNSSIEVKGNLNNITIPQAKTFKNYYGDGSTLNLNIENYKVDNFDFISNKISRMRFSEKIYFSSSPIVVDNNIYFLDTRGNLISRNLDTNKNSWKTKVVEKSNIPNYYGGKISYYNGNLYLTTRLNEVISVSSTDGIINWRKKLNTIPISAPVIENTTIYVITNDNKLYALDSNDGRIKWISFGNPKNSAILGSANPVIYKNYVIASYSSGELFILNKETGENIFNTNITGKYMIYSNFELTDIDSTPVIVDNILIATANNGVATAINLDTMRIIWKQNLPSITNILKSNATIYLMTTDNILISLDATNGKIYWSIQFDRFKNMKKKKDLVFYSSIAMINGKVYAFNNNNEYKIINPKNGELEKTTEMDLLLYSIPFSLNNKLYAIGRNGRTIYFVNTK